MSNEPGNINPYSPPQHSPTAQPPAESISSEDLVRLQEFRLRTLYLSWVWIFLAFVASGAFIASMMANRPNTRSFDLVDLFIATTLITSWIIAAVGTSQRAMWGFYVGLVVSYLGLLSCVLLVQPIGLLFQLVILFQTHLVIRSAKRLRLSGISLTAKPKQYVVT